MSTSPAPAWSMTVGPSHLLMEPGHTAHDRAGPVAAAAESAARSVSDEDGKARALARLAEVLAAAGLYDQAEAVARSITGSILEPEMQAKALGRRRLQPPGYTTGPRRSPI